MTTRQLFLQHNAQTSDAPLQIEIVKAEGMYMFDAAGKMYLDAIGGISVANIGHGNLNVIDAIYKQSQAYMHIMVYGELIQQPQTQYAHLLTQYLPDSLNSVYFTNSGSEAIEGAMKLAKRITNRHKILACNNSYHGSSQGALSLIGDEYWRNAYRPLLPEIYHYSYNSQAIVDAIDKTTAAVFVETVQAESGIIPANIDWLTAIAEKCKQTGTQLVLDESQCGFGRTGTLWAFEQYKIVPDILVLAKALGGGMPMGAFICDKQKMDVLSANPVLGHITTFGGHPVCCTAGMAAFKELINQNLVNAIAEKSKYLEDQLKSIPASCYSVKGLWASVFFKDYPTTKKIIDKCIDNGVFTDWFLFASNAIRISPPLIISFAEIDVIINSIKKAVEETS
jgi:acetylornithine/N-succinyldiaminopimelate aminotransferase